MQVAHFLEADLQPWAAALAAALFDSKPRPPAVPANAPQPSERGSSARVPLTRHADAWRLLEEVAPYGDTVDTVLRASRLSLLQQLPLTPAEWQPAVVHSHAVAGALKLDSAAVDACCDVMPALHGVESLSLHLNRHAVHAEEWALRRVVTAVASLPALRRLKVETGCGDSPNRLMRTMTSVLRPTSLNSSGENAPTPLGHLPAPLELGADTDGVGAAGARPPAQPLDRLTALRALDLSRVVLGCFLTQKLVPLLSCLHNLEELKLADCSLWTFRKFSQPTTCLLYTSPSPRD